MGARRAARRARVVRTTPFGTAIPPIEGDRPWVIGHRGASAEHPENTIAAFDAALAAGVDGIELDLQLTRDGAPVVYHDRTLVRAGGGRHRVARIDSNRLTELSVRGPKENVASAPIPGFSQVLDRYLGSTRLLIELKAREQDRRDGTTRRLVETVTGALVARTSPAVAVLSFDAGALDHVAELAPDLPTVRNWRGPLVTRATVERAVAGRQALSVPVSLVTPRLVSLAHDGGVPVLVFTANTFGQLRRALAAGVDAIMSDRPAWLIAALAGEALRK